MLAKSYLNLRCGRPDPSRRLSGERRWNIRGLPILARRQLPLFTPDICSDFLDHSFTHVALFSLFEFSLLSLVLSIRLQQGLDRSSFVHCAINGFTRTGCNQHAGCRADGEP